MPSVGAIFILIGILAIIVALKIAKTVGKFVVGTILLIAIVSFVFGGAFIL